MPVVQVDLDPSGIATLTINRPEALNALNGDVLAALESAAKDLVGKAKALIVTGAGKAFVAGADIAAMKDLDGDAATAFAHRGHAVGHAFADFPGPVIAAINGYALGGGLELAMACDILIASDKAVVGQPEVKLGVVPGFGGSQRLSRRVGPGVAKLLLMTGENVKADEALRMGIVDKVVPHDLLLAEARKVAEACMANGPLAVQFVKALVDDGLDLPLDEALDLEADTFGDSFRTADQKEGMAAFLGKRKAAFKGA
ncbi:MAG: enoyl-CoA hydratase-related protein [Candidatus Thermoplasmatota archaeon]